MQHVVGLVNTASGDDRTIQTRTRLRRKLGQRRASDNINNSNNSSQQNQKISPPQKATVNGWCIVRNVCHHKEFNNSLNTLQSYFL